MYCGLIYKLNNSFVDQSMTTTNIPENSIVNFRKKKQFLFQMSFV